MSSFDSILEVRSLNNKQLLYTLDIVTTTAKVGDIREQLSITKKIPKQRVQIRSAPSGPPIDDDIPLAVLAQCSHTVYMKDLGPQISWTLVFVLEYLAPLLIYAGVFYNPQYFYSTPTKKDKPYDVPLILWSSHFVKRLLETLFVHRFSHETMPLRNLFKNCGYYWGFALFIAYHVNHPYYTPPPKAIQIIGTTIFFFCQLGNLSTHILFRNLRPSGSKVRCLPVPDANPFNQLFKLVACPNYTYEFGAWLGFSMVTSCLPAVMFALSGFYQMAQWAIDKHNKYIKEFPKYNKHKKVILPGIL